MPSATESELLSKLESSDSKTIYTLFSDYLRPFSNKTETLRSLTKQYLPFLNKAISILPKRLSKLKEAKEPEETALVLFQTYNLCLDCLDLVCSELSCKPYTMQIQRLRLIYWLDTWEQYTEGVKEGFRVLERLKAIYSGSRKKEVKTQYLPGGEDEDEALAKLVIEVVAYVVMLVAKEAGNDVDQYMRVLVLLEEVRPCLRAVDCNGCDKLHKLLVTYLGKCTLLLVGEVMNFNGELICAFCVEALREYANSSMKDQIYQFGRRICSSLFLYDESRTSLAGDILDCVLHFLADKCKAEFDNSRTDFVELVSYCANKSRMVGKHSSSIVAKHLNEIAVDSCQILVPINLILKLYSTGLYVTDNHTCRQTNSEPTVRILVDDENTWQNVSTLLGSLESFFCTDTKEFTSLDSKHEYPKESRKEYLLHYVNALKFLCQPLADFIIHSEKKKILAEIDIALPTLIVIHDACLQCCDAFLFLQRSESEGKRDSYDDDKTILIVAVTAFILSIRIQRKMKKSVHLVKHIIASKWIQPHGLKYLFSSLFNIGLNSHRSKRLEEASRALNLSCRASWACVGLLCQMFDPKSKSSDKDISEEAIIEFVTDACSRYAFFFDVLQQCGNQKINKYIMYSLESWSVAGHLFKNLPGPMPIVKHWVKTGCKLYKNMNPGDTYPTLYGLMAPSGTFSKAMLRILLEQELLAYDEMAPQYPVLCRLMQVEITEILLKEVYVTIDCSLERSRILLKKGRAIRALGSERLKDGIRCLSEAISVLIDDTRGETLNYEAPIYHQLAVTYCLRALCIQEAEPSSKQVFQDIRDAVNLWLKILTADHCHPDDQCAILSDNTMQLLGNIFDLLSLKGCIELHHQIFEVIFRLLKWKNVPLENGLTKLWESRRLSHALCATPINEAVIFNLSEDCDQHPKHISSWISGIKDLHLLVGFQQNFSAPPTKASASYNHQRLFPSDLTVNYVKETAAELLSGAPLSSRSAFFAGYMYHDLCERLISLGQLCEALSYAKEAHQLRTRLFKETFKYSVEKQVEQFNDEGIIIERSTYCVGNFEVFKSAASKMWPSDSVPRDVDDFYLSPWRVLECYLESTLKVGIVNELTGNGAEAETLLLWGKSISSSQNLLLFTIAFCCALGKVYRKKKLWDSAEKELQCAKQLLLGSLGDFTCFRCRLVLEATVDQQLGDLIQNRLGSLGAHFETEKLAEAESLYKTALEKLHLPVWKNPISCSQETSEDGINFGQTCLKNFEYNTSYSSSCSSSNQSREGPKAKINTRKGRKTKNAPKDLLKEQPMIPEHTPRITRSKCQSSKSQDLSRELRKSSVVDSCICEQRKCWQCLPEVVMESGLLENFISLRWEVCRRRLLMRVLTSLGKCLQSCGRIQEAHEIIWRSISCLCSRNPFCLSYPSSLALLDLMEKEFTGDMFAVERAAVIYTVCWSSLKAYSSKNTRSVCCALSQVQLPKLVSWLKLAFVLCREAPILFQKVSRLLGAIYILSTSNNNYFSLPSSCNELSESHWASFFHQASLGTNSNHQFYSNLSSRRSAQSLSNDEGSDPTDPISSCPETLDFPRLAPKTTEDLEKFIINFFIDLPSSTVVCISLLGGAFASLLQELLLCSSSVCAWILLSRLSSQSQPVVVLLPVDSITEESSDDDVNSEFGKVTQSKASVKQWHCPWGSTVVDDVVPAFKQILEENYLSSSYVPSEDTKSYRSLWWTRRKKLDQRLGKLLRDLEDSWLGSWRYVLVGEPTKCKVLDAVHKKLVRDLKSKCKMDANGTLVKVILGGGLDGFEGDACIAQLCIKNGCYIGVVGHCEDDSCRTPTSKIDGAENHYSLALQLVHDAVSKLQEEDKENREAIILVLDCGVQMLPWENMPVLRKQEVYRMPSVASIFATLNLCCPHQDRIASLPLVDPLDAFYLLNPSGDLRDSQLQFESWFRDQNLKGKAGTVPTAKELAVALKSHDFFLYFGHGSGVQYISTHDIEKLENCAATLLMGCSSGSLSLSGCYAPQGAPLSYLLAGSPIIVANLWEVTDKDIDRFGKAMLEAWLKERSNPDSCAECNCVIKEFAAMDINTKKKVSRKKTADIISISGSGSSKTQCEHNSYKRKIGSFMAQAREACTLPFLIGAAPVCYGVPTGIRTKDDL